MLVCGAGHWHALHSAQALGVIRGVPTAEKVVALTYDDGPHPTFTAEILRLLDAYGVKATFFLIGNRVERYPDIVCEMVAKGHAIGNHTYSHPRNLDLESRGQVLVELIQCEAEIRKVTGKRTELFRPPKGIANEQVTKIASDLGYKTVLWTVCADNRFAFTPQMMANRVLSKVSPGSIVLAHDGIYPMRWRDVAATPLIIEGLRRQGYRFVTVPELLEMQSAEPPAAQRAGDHRSKETNARAPHKAPKGRPASGG